MEKALESPVEPGSRPDSAKRRQIIDGACRVFLAQGFDAASMGAIAKEAGVSKGTLYVYFKSKDDLFAAIVEEQCREQGLLIFTLDPSDHDVEATLTRVGTEFARFMCRPGGLPVLRTIIAIADRMPVLGKQFYEAGPRRGQAALMEYLEAQVAAGVLKPHDSEVAAAQFIDSCLSIIFKPVLFNFAGPPNDETIARVVAIAVRTFLAAYKA
ncbi:MAG TPA: TetR/AcrR family transcriptional regulator [Hyphomicrobiaceae bacterium]|nr:TetR/AcrR family transcriptional regulator [Hyphomicrobiaceae bacterium]